MCVIGLPGGAREGKGTVFLWNRSGLFLFYCITAAHGCIAFWVVTCIGMWWGASGAVLLFFLNNGLHLDLVVWLKLYSAESSPPSSTFLAFLVPNNVA